jgi:amino acid adenylation domain-containing protein
VDAVSLDRIRLLGMGAKLVGRRDNFFDVGEHLLIHDAGKQFTAPTEFFFALTASQIPIWVDQSLYPQKPIYNVGQTLILRTAVDIKCFVAALERVVAENDALRIRLVERDSDIVQQVVNEVFVHLEFGDFSGEREPEAAARAWTEQVFWKPLGATDFPLFQFALAKLAADRFLWLQKYHHLIMDATGRRLVAARVAAVYDAISAGVEPPAADGGAYLALAKATDDQYLASSSWTADEEYWRTRFADLPEPLVRIDARLSEKSRSGRPTQLAWGLSREASDALRTFARSQGSTLYKVIFALVWCCLSRLYGRSDLVFGVPLANRKSAEARRTLGQFAKVMPFRPRLNTAMTFAAALSALDTGLSKDLEHQRFPFHYFNRLLPRRRGPDGLYDVIVNFQRNDYGFSLGGASVTCSNSWVGFAVPWSITAFEYAADDAIHMVIAYDSGRIPSEEATRFLQCFQELLQRAPEAAEIAIGRLPMVPAEERAALMRRGQGQPVALPESATLPILLARQAARSPHATALVCGAERLTYAELHARADRLSRRLFALGVGPETLVGISLPRTIVLIVAILAVHKAGGAYLPLDPCYPQHRLVFMVEDSNTKIILTDAASAALLTRTGARLLLLDESQEDAREHSAFQLGNGVEPSDLAYVLYTSGSTGNPKGVAVTHGGVVNLVLSSRSIVSDEDLSGVLFATSLNFDISVYEIFLPLACGGAIIMVDDLFGLTTAPARDEVRIVNTVPSLMAALLKEGSLPVGVHLVNLVGEALPRALADRIFADQTDVRVFNLYGPTETTVYSTWSAVDRNDRRPPSIGVPLSNTEVYVLDEFLQPVPAGCIGELWIGGMGVSRGYLDRSELTRQRFIPNPFGEGRIYKTGDLGAWLSDGQLRFAGRIDHQVKIRGCRIELGEIESVLKLHPAVRDSVVVVRKDPSFEERLVAYVTPASSSAIPINELRSLLKQRLPAYMVPSAFILLDAFPVTPNGKLDRNALLAPNLATPESLQSNVAPRTPTEHWLAGIWCEVLNVKQVGVYDDFFECGGHSLLAMQVVARTLNALAVNLSLRTFFENPTISSLADEIENLLRTAFASRKLISQSQPIPAVDRSEPVALSFAQQRLWFQAQLEGASEAYHLPLDVRLSGRLDSDALRRALDGLVARHEVLRTSFNLLDGQPRQRIAAADSGFTLAEHDLRGNTNGESELRRLVEVEATAPFDLEHGPLIRGRLVLLAEDEHVLLITMHHIVSDGWSMGLVIKELSKLYASFQRGEADPLPALPIQYADYAAWQRHWLQGGIVQREAEYWKAALSGAPALLELPADRPRPPQQDFAGALVEVALDAGLTQRLKALSRRHRVTLFMTLLAVWAALLTRLSGQDEVVVGSATANRTRPEIEPLIGFFVNMLALRINVSGAPTTSELLARVKAQALSAQEHHDIPFEQVVEAVQPPRSLAHSPLFQVAFAWQNAPQSDFELPGLRVSPIAPPHVTAKFDLLLSLEEEGEEIVGGLEYATGLFDRKTIERYLSYWRNLLEAIAANDTLTIDRLPLLSESERHQLLVEWNDTNASCPTRTVQDLFEEQAAQRPEAAAVVFGQSELTYAKLNAQANQLAHYLKGLGVKENSLVGFCIERSSELIVTLLGILKAGGAYVALDPKIPSRRLQYILEDVQPTAIVVKSELQKKAIIASLALTQRCGLKGPPVVVCLEQDINAIGNESAANPYSGATSESPAYACFTSGSTGRPKGVSIPHRGIVRLIKNSNYISVSTSDVFLQLAPVSFDASTFEIWGCLLNGARLVVPAPELLSPAELGSAIREHGVSVLWLTAGLFHLMIEHELHSLNGVRQLLAGGEVLSMAHVREALERLGEGRLINGYGPTENTTFTCCHSITRSSLNRHSIPIGRPISNTQCFILDRSFQPVPIGVRGELFTGGDGLALGYLNDSKLTAEKFISNPFRPGTLLYRTGDLARYLSDGNIEFLGRVDDQVKIRGFRVELGEVESVLKLNPAVQEAAVVLHDASGDKTLVAYVSPVDIAVKVDGLQSFLKERLPVYMLPSTFVFLDTLPLSPNGKLDRKALPPPEGRSPETGQSFVAPRTPMEEALTGMWCEVFGLKQVGVRDNFFNLGGHSLMIVGLIDRVNRTLNVNLGISELFQNPTVERMARMIHDSPVSRPTYPAGVVEIRRGTADPPIFYLPGLGSTALEFCGLSTKMDTHRPILVIELHGLKLEPSVLNSIEYTAEAVVQRMRQVQPVGPYIIIGYSFGGNLAVEVARQLTADDQSCESVIIIDAYAPDSFRGPKGLSKLVAHLRNIGRLNFHESYAYISSRIQRRLFPQSQNLRDAAPALPLPKYEIERRISHQALHAHRPRVFSGRIVLFRASVEVNDPSGTCGWSSKCKGGVDVIPLACRHLDVFKEPNVTVLAGHINDLLKAIDRSHRRGRAIAR